MRAARAAALLGLVAGARSLYRGLVAGSITVDTGRGRRVRPLGPRTWEFEATVEEVFDLLTVPYGPRPPRALREKVEVWERGAEMVLAAHRTPVRGRTVTTVETVRFERPHRISFRLVRGPVPHLTEHFDLTDRAGGARLTWSGELGTDGGALGAWWGDRVAHAWERAVAQSLQAVTDEISRRGHGRSSS